MITGTSREMQEIMCMLPKIAHSPVPIMITGETGTGKELIANEIHKLSRKKEAYVKVNCAALQNTLLESELFGHERGAFTGAMSQKQGKFEIASKGTLFLDEIGDMEAQTQAKILRVLDQQTFERVGGVKTIKVDTRIISATNKDIKYALAKKEFRPDLFYRLNTVKFHLPPLRSRKKDIPELVDYYIKEFNSLYHRKVKRITKKAMSTFMQYTWPGNIRELRNILERAFLLCEGTVIPDDALLLTNNTSFPDMTTNFDTAAIGEFLDVYGYKNNIIEKAEEAILFASLMRRGSQKEAAEEVGISPRVMCYKIKKYKSLQRWQRTSNDTQDVS